MAKRIESLLDDAKYNEALDFLKTESSEHVHRAGLLQIVKAKFPTKPLAGAPEASQQMADCPSLRFPHRACAAPELGLTRAPSHVLIGCSICVGSGDASPER